MQASKGPPYSNLTPWLKTLFFIHTYFDYIFVFYMFLMCFYKGYALEYPWARRQAEMGLVMFLPLMSHSTFYFGHSGCETGEKVDLCIFLFSISGKMWAIMYFLFKQAYIFHMDIKLCFIAELVTGIEGACGVMNILQTINRKSGKLYTATVSVCVLLFIITAVFLLVLECWPAQEPEVIQQRRRLHSSRHS